MPPPASPAPVYDLILLAFAGGFAIATMIFWPLLHRAQHRFDHHGRLRSATGKHARPEPANAKGTKAAARTADAGFTSVTATSTQPSAAASDTAGRDVTNASEQSSVVPAPRQSEPVELPEPNDLFRQHHAAQFNRSRERLARLRSQLNDL